MGAQLNIESEDAYRLASRLAEPTGDSQSTVVTKALRAEPERAERDHGPDRHQTGVEGLTMTDPTIHMRGEPLRRSVVPEDGWPAHGSRETAGWMLPGPGKAVARTKGVNAMTNEILIQDADAIKLASELSDLTGDSLKMVVVTALRQEVERERARKARQERIMNITREIALSARYGLDHANEAAGHGLAA
jgi:hypothetical protein